MFKLFNRKSKVTQVEIQKIIEDNPLIDEYHKQREESQRTLQEIDKCSHLSILCIKLIGKYGHKIPTEDYRYIMLHEGFTSFLPISIKEFLTPQDIMFTFIPLGRSTRIKPTL